MKKETNTNEVPTPKVTKAKLVLSHLLKKKSITSLEAIELYSATRLSAIIFNLREKKYDIVTKDITIKDKYGNNCIFGKYILQGVPKK